jgi:hypothetical protein
MNNFIVNNTECNNCVDPEKKCEYSRNDFFKTCAPLFNLLDCDYNILNIEENGYIHYKSSVARTYALTKSFGLKYVSTSPSTDLKYEKYNPTMLDKHIDKCIQIEDYKYNVPIYYAYCNKNNDIFNIFINYHLFSIQSHKKKQKDGEKKIIDDILSIHRTKENFVNLSYKFNIFNVSFICDKFFKIYHLFMKNDRDIDRDTEQNVIEELDQIFAGYELDKLYFNNSYYKSISLMKKQDSTVFLNENTKKYYRLLYKVKNIAFILE